MLIDINKDRDAFAEWVHRTWCPLVVVIASDTAKTALLRSNGMTFSDLLQPFSRSSSPGNSGGVGRRGFIGGGYMRGVPRSSLNAEFSAGTVTYRVLEKSVQSSCFQVRFVDSEECDGPPSAYASECTMAQSVELCEASYDETKAPGGLVPVPPFPWFDNYLDTLSRSLCFQPYDSLSQPTATLLVVSSAEALGLFQQPEGEGGGDAPPQSPPPSPSELFEQLMHPSFLPADCRKGLLDAAPARLFCLYHDNVSMPQVTDAQLQSLLQQMRNTFPPSSCLLLKLSRPAPPPGTPAEGGEASIRSFFADRYLPKFSRYSAPARMQQRLPGPWHPSFASSLRLEDLTLLSAAVQEMVSKTVIPWMEKKVRSLDEKVAQARKGLRNQIRYLLGRGRKGPGGQGGEGGAGNAAGGSETSAILSSVVGSGIDAAAAAWAGGNSQPPGGSSGAGGAGSGQAGRNGSGAPVYTTASVELQQRALADLCFLLRLYDRSASLYKAAAADFKHDRALAHWAAASEMWALSLALSGSTQQRREAEPIVEQAVSGFKKAGLPRQALRASLLGFRLLAVIGDPFSSDPVKLLHGTTDIVIDVPVPMVSQSAEANSNQQAQQQQQGGEAQQLPQFSPSFFSTLRSALISEQMAHAYARASVFAQDSRTASVSPTGLGADGGGSASSWGAGWVRRSAFHSVLAGHSFNKTAAMTAGSPFIPRAFKRLALRCYRSVTAGYWDPPLFGREPILHGLPPLESELQAKNQRAEGAREGSALGLSLSAGPGRDVEGALLFVCDHLIFAMARIYFQLDSWAASLRHFALVLKAIAESQAPFYYSAIAASHWVDAARDGAALPVIDGVEFGGGGAELEAASPSAAAAAVAAASPQRQGSSTEVGDAKTEALFRSSGADLWTLAGPNTGQRRRIGKDREAQYVRELEYVLKTFVKREAQKLINHMKTVTSSVEAGGEGGDPDEADAEAFLWGAAAAAGAVRVCLDVEVPFVACRDSRRRLVPHSVTVLLEGDRGAVGEGGESASLLMEEVQKRRTSLSSVSPESFITMARQMGISVGKEDAAELAWLSLRYSSRLGGKGPSDLLPVHLHADSSTASRFKGANAVLPGEEETDEERAGLSAFEELSRQVAVGSPVSVVIRLVNPLQVPLHLEDLRLLAHFETTGVGGEGVPAEKIFTRSNREMHAADFVLKSLEPGVSGGVRLSVDVAELSRATLDESSDAAGLFRRVTGNQGEEVEVGGDSLLLPGKSLTIGPLSSLDVTLVALPLREGALRIRGVAWSLFGSLEVRHEFRPLGRRRKRRKGAAKAAAVMAAPLNPHPPVTQPLPPDPCPGDGTHAPDMRLRLHVSSAVPRCSLRVEGWPEDEAAVAMRAADAAGSGRAAVGETALLAGETRQVSLVVSNDSDRLVISELSLCASPADCWVFPPQAQQTHASSAPKPGTGGVSVDATPQDSHLIVCKSPLPPGATLRIPALLHCPVAGLQRVRVCLCAEAVQPSERERSQDSPPPAKIHPSHSDPSLAPAPASAGPSGHVRGINIAMPSSPDLQNLAAREREKAEQGKPNGVTPLSLPFAGLAAQPNSRLPLPHGAAGDKEAQASAAAGLGGRVTIAPSASESESARVGWGAGESRGSGGRGEERRGRKWICMERAVLVRPSLWMRDVMIRPSVKDENSFLLSCTVENVSDHVLCLGLPKECGGASGRSPASFSSSSPCGLGGANGDGDPNRTVPPPFGILGGQRETIVPFRQAGRGGSDLTAELFPSQARRIVFLFRHPSGPPKPNIGNGQVAAAAAAGVGGLASEYGGADTLEGQSVPLPTDYSHHAVPKDFKPHALVKDIGAGCLEAVAPPAGVWRRQVVRACRLGHSTREAEARERRRKARLDYQPESDALDPILARSSAMQQKLQEQHQRGEAETKSPGVETPDLAHLDVVVPWRCEERMKSGEVFEFKVPLTPSITKCPLQMSAIPEAYSIQWTAESLPSVSVKVCVRNLSDADTVDVLVAADNGSASRDLSIAQAALSGVTDDGPITPDDITGGFLRGFFWTGETAVLLRDLQPGAAASCDLEATFVSPGVFDLNKIRLEILKRHREGGVPAHGHGAAASGGQALRSSTDPSHLAEGRVFVFTNPLLVCVGDGGGGERSAGLHHGKEDLLSNVPSPLTFQPIASTTGQSDTITPSRPKFLPSVAVPHQQKKAQEIAQERGAVAVAAPFQPTSMSNPLSGGPTRISPPPPPPPAARRDGPSPPPPPPTSAPLSDPFGASAAAPPPIPPSRPSPPATPTSETFPPQNAAEAFSSSAFPPPQCPPFSGSPPPQSAPFSVSPPTPHMTQTQMPVTPPVPPVVPQDVPPSFPIQHKTMQSPPPQSITPNPQGLYADPTPPHGPGPSEPPFGAAPFQPTQPPVDPYGFPSTQEYPREDSHSGVPQTGFSGPQATAAPSHSHFPASVEQPQAPPGPPVPAGPGGMEGQGGTSFESDLLGVFPSEPSGHLRYPSDGMMATGVPTQAGMVPGVHAEAGVSPDIPTGHAPSSSFNSQQQTRIGADPSGEAFGNFEVGLAPLPHASADPTSSRIAEGGHTALEGAVPMTREREEEEPTGEEEGEHFAARPGSPSYDAVAAAFGLEGEDSNGPAGFG